MNLSFLRMSLVCSNITHLQFIGGSEFAFLYGLRLDNIVKKNVYELTHGHQISLLDLSMQNKRDMAGTSQTLQNSSVSRPKYIESSKTVKRQSFDMGW